MLFMTTSFGNGDYDLQRDSPRFPHEPSCQIGSASVLANPVCFISVPAEPTADWPIGTDVIANDTTQYQANQD